MMCIQQWCGSVAHFRRRAFCDTGSLWLVAVTVSVVWCCVFDTPILVADEKPGERSREQAREADEGERRKIQRKVIRKSDGDSGREIRESEGRRESDGDPRNRENREGNVVRQKLERNEREDLERREKSEREEIQHRKESSAARGNSPPVPPQLMRMIQELRSEVARLRQEMQQLRAELNNRGRRPADQPRSDPPIRDRARRDEVRERDPAPGRPDPPIRRRLFRPDAPRDQSPQRDAPRNDPARRDDPPRERTDRGGSPD